MLPHLLQSGDFEPRLSQGRFPITRQIARQTEGRDPVVPVLAPFSLDQKGGSPSPTGSSGVAGTCFLTPNALHPLSFEFHLCGVKDDTVAGPVVSLPSM